MGKFGDYVTSTQFRDIIRTIVTNQLELLRPKPKLATVQTVDRTHKTATVIYVGETDPVTVRMPGLQPLAVGGQVLMDGPASSRYIAQVMGDIYTPPPPIQVAAGIIAAYGGYSIPDGWLVCNGQAVSRTVYADLFAAISTYYGYGDGSTTFNIPNFMNSFLYGTNPGLTGGDVTHTHKAAAHQHTYDTDAHTHSMPAHSHGLSDGYAMIEMISGVIRAAVYNTASSYSANVSATITMVSGQTTAGAYILLGGSTDDNTQQNTFQNDPVTATTDLNTGVQPTTNQTPSELLPPYVGAYYIIKT